MPTGYLLRRLVFYFLKLGTIGFGGPIALAGYMQRDLVDDRKWFTEEEYLDTSWTVYSFSSNRKRTGRSSAFRPE